MISEYDDNINDQFIIIIKYNNNKVIIRLQLRTLQIIIIVEIILKLIKIIILAKLQKWFYK